MKERNRAVFYLNTLLSCHIISSSLSVLFWIVSFFRVDNTFLFEWN